MSTPVSVKILDKEYLVACPPGQQDSLRRAADYLDRRMREIRGSGKVVGMDRIAVMAALNIADELLNTRTSDSELDDVRASLRAMNARISSVLNED